MLTEIQQDVDLSNAYLDKYFEALVQSDGNALKVRNEILASGLRNEQIRQLSISHIIGSGGREEDEAGMRAITDYITEKYFFPSMNLYQARQYYMNILDVMELDLVTLPKPGRPVILESMHSVYCFSVIFVMLRVLVEEAGFRKAVMLHQNEPLDPRAQYISDILQHLDGVSCKTIPFKDRWYDELKSFVDESTILIYMGDMPPRLFPKQHKRNKTSSELIFKRQNLPSLQLEGFTFSGGLRERLNAQHYLLDFQNNKTLRFQQAGPVTRLECDLSDWFFWPYLNVFMDPHEMAPTAAE